MSDTYDVFFVKTWEHKIKSIVPTLQSLIIKPMIFTNNFEVILSWSINDDLLYYRLTFKKYKKICLDTILERVNKQQDVYLSIKNHNTFSISFIHNQMLFKHYKLSNGYDKLPDQKLMSFIIKFISDEPRKNINNQFQTYQQLIDSDIKHLF